MNSFRQYKQSLVESSSSPGGGGGSDTQQQRLSRGDSKGQYSLWTGPQPYLWADPNTQQDYEWGPPSSMPEEGWYADPAPWLIQPHPVLGGGKRWQQWSGPRPEGWVDPLPAPKPMTDKEIEEWEDNQGGQMIPLSLPWWLPTPLKPFWYLRKKPTLW